LKTVAREKKKSSASVGDVNKTTTVEAYCAFNPVESPLVG